MPITNAAEYLEAVVRRTLEPLDPPDFEPDWADKPRRHNVYPGVRAVPLPSATVPPATIDRALAGGTPAANGTFTLQSLAEMLRDSYAYNGRRLAVTANGDSATLSQYAHATWSRGTASGGGLYPIEIYWICGPSGPMLPGVYNYSAPSHGMQRLLVGDVCGQVRRAVAPTGGDQFLLVTVRFWKNTFKYRNFGYHAVTMDVGAALSTWQFWARAAGVELRPLLTFDEQALNRLLGVKTHEESVFAVVPLPWRGSGPPGERGRETRVPARAVERSRRVVRYPVVERVHATTVESPATGTSLPERLVAARPAVPDRHRGDAIRLPPAFPITGTVRELLRLRRSSFGAFSARKPLDQARLSAVLRGGTLGARLVSDVKSATGQPELTRLALFVNHVDGVPPDVYDYEITTNSLLPRGIGSSGHFLQRTYSLANYNLEQAAAVVVVLARPRVAMSAVGNRGYRFLNAEVGAAAQALYITAAGVGIGAGVALGFDNVSYLDHLSAGQDDWPDDWPLLIMILGHERPTASDFRFRLS